jgi:hypothetical protein
MTMIRAAAKDTKDGELKAKVDLQVIVSGFERKDVSNNPAPWQCLPRFMFISSYQPEVRTTICTCYSPIVQSTHIG